MADTTNPLEPAVEGEPTYFPSKPAKEESPFLKPGQVITTLGEPAPTPYVDEGAIEKGKATEQLLADAKKREQSKVLQPPGDQWVYNGVTEQVEKAQSEAPPNKPPPPPSPPPTQPYEKEYKPEERLPTPPTWDQITGSPDWHKLDSDGKLKVIDRYTSDLKTMGHAEAERTQQDPKAYEAEADNFNKTERAKLESPLSILQNTGKEFDRGAIHKTAQIGVGLAREAKNLLYPELDLSDIGHMTVDQAKNELGELTKINQPKYDELEAKARDFLDKSSHFPGYFINHPDEYFQGGKVGDMRYVPGANGAIQVIQQSEANRRRIDALNTYVNSNGTEAPKQTAGEEFMEITGKLPEQASNAIKIDEVYKRYHPIAGHVAETIGAITPYALSNILTGGMGTVPAWLIPEAMGISDSFQTTYEGAQAKLDEREAHGEHFTPYERERLALDDATRTSLGQGSFYAAANMSLGGAMEDIQAIPWLKTEMGETVRQNWFKYLLTGGIDAAIQGQIQAGASVIGNIGDRAAGVDPRRKWYEGIGEAELTGMGFGLFGTGFRVHHALVESNKIGQLAQDATRQADELLNSPSGAGITRSQALELTIAGATAQEPHYRDAVRARLTLDAAGADEKKTAADIQDIAPETSKALDKDGDNTAGTSVTPVTKAQDQLQELRDRIKKKKEEREAAVNVAGTAGQAAAKGVTTTAPQEEGETTQETRAAEAEKATSGPRELSPQEKAAKEKRRKGINDQLDDYLGLDATDEDRKALLKDYLERNLYQNGNESTSEQRRSAAQLMHELGIDTREKLPDTWKANTHESVAGMEQNFSDWLAGRIKERREGVEAGHQALVEGVKANDSTKLKDWLGEKKTLPITDEEVEKYDDFFMRHGFDVNFDENEKPYLTVRPEAEEEAKELPEPPKEEPKRKVRMDVALRQNSDEFANSIAALDPHPFEGEHVKQAYQILNTKGAARINKDLGEGEKKDAEEIQSAAMFSFIQHLRRYAKRKKELGQENQLVPPGTEAPAMEETPPEEAEAEEEQTPEEEEGGAKKELKPIEKLPNIWSHINWILKQYGGRRKANLTIDPEDVVRLNKAPLGLPEGSTLENVVSAQIQRHKAGLSAQEEAEKGEEEAAGGIAAAEKETGKEFSWPNIGKGDYVTLAKEYIPTLPEKDQRIGWYFLRVYKFITPDEVPEGVKGATNISRGELKRVARQIGNYVQRNYQPGPPQEAGKPEGPPGRGGGGYPPPAGGGGVPAETHPKPVLPGTELPGHEAGGPPPGAGGREPGVRKEGEAAAGQPERVLPEERGGPGVGAGVTERPPAPGGAGALTAEAERGAAPAGERGGGAQRPGGATAASRERTIHVQERPGHERGGPNPTGSGNLPGGGSIAGAGVSAGGRGAGVEATTTGLETVGKMGGAISQNMRDMLWDKFEKGVTTEAGGPSNVLLLAAREKIAGRITTRQEFEDYLNRYGESLKAKQPINEFAESEATRQAAPPSAEATPLDIAKGLLKKPEIAEDHGIDVKDFNTPQELVDHLSELEDNHDDPEAWYKEMAADLGIKAPKAAAPAAAPTLAEIIKTPYTPPERRAEIREQILSKMGDARRKMYETKPDLIAAIDRQVEEQWSKEEDAAIRSRAAQAILPTPKPPAAPTPGRIIKPNVKDIAKATLENPETAKEFSLDLNEVFGGETPDAKNPADLQHLTDHINTALELLDPERKRNLLDRWASGLTRSIQEKAPPPPAAKTEAPTVPSGVEQVSKETGIEPEVIEELVHRERIQATQGLNRPVKPKLENIRLLLDRSEPNIPLALNVIKDLQGTIGTAKVPESSSKLDYVKAQGDQAFKDRKGDLITNLGEARTALEAGDTAKALEFVKNLEEKPPPVAAEGTRKLETILKTGALPPEPAAAPGVIAREDVSSNKSALEHLKTLRQLDADIAHVETWPDQMRADYISKMGLTVAPTDEIPGWIPTMGDFAIKDPETGKITVGQSNYSAINKMGEAARKPNIIEGRIVDGKFVPDVGGVADKTAEVNAIRKSLQERSDTTLNRMAKVLGRTPEEVNHFVRTLGDEELKPTKPKPKPKAPTPSAVDPVVQASDPVRIAEATTPPLATKINDYLKANPDTATHWGINPGDDILARYRQLRPKATPEEENNFVQAMAQRLGLTDPPHDTDTAKRAGKMHSMKPGVAKAHAALSGDAQDLVNHLRTSTNPEEQAFARSLNAHARTLRGVYIYTADHPDPVVYMEGKNLWASPSVVDHPLGHLAVAQELQHVIAYKKLRMPQTSDEFESVAHWEYLRSRVESHLPAELRGELHTTFSDLFNKFDATGHLDNRALTPAEERYLPFMYAARRGESLLNSVFSSRAYRDYLKILKEPDGRSVWDGVENWGKRIFGDQAFKYLDDVEPLTGNTPGIKYRGPMPDLTIAEQRTKRLFNKYRLNENNAQAALESVVKHAEDPRLKHVAEAMVNVAKQYPEITVGLQDRLGGDAGGYIFFGDHVMVNPNYSDEQIQHTIVHEMVHAFVNGKIKAFLNGQVHLVTAQDAAAITRLLDLRNHVLKHPSIPKEMQQIAGHKTYGDRIDAYIDWAQKNPHAGDTYYGLTDLTEFATEALSNGKFQELLDKIPYTLKEAYGPTKPRTVLQKAFQFIRNLLGFKEDTVLSRAFEDVSKLMGGRRVMEADYNVGFLHGTKTLKAQENLMAKRELDRRAKEGGFDSTREVPIDRLNQWVQEWRQGQGMASGVVDPTKTYTKTSRTDTRAQIQGSDKLSAMTRPADIIDHLANVTGTRHDDIESLNDVVRQAFKNKAINLDQFSKSMQALDQGSNEVYHRLHLDMGDEKDNHSAISRWTRFHHLWRPEGNLPKEAYEAMQKQVYESQASAFEIQNRWKDLRSALAKEWKISPSDVVKHNDIREALNNMLEGKPAGRTMPRSVIEATDAMRAAVERRSLNILDEDMVSGDKWSKIEENLGTYMARSYRLFDDPRFLSRPESQKYRSAAEKEVDAMMRGESRAREARRIAENAREDAKRNFATGSTAGEDAGQKAYDAAYTDALANVGKHALDRMLAHWEQRAENRETKMLQFGHAFGINDKLMARLTKMPENVRKLIGEERDPFARFANTIWRQQNFINTVRLSRDLSRLGEEGGYITKRLTDTNTRQIPKGFSHLGDLAGRYTTPEIAGALTKFQENIEALPSSNPALNVIRQFESTARYTTTILSTMRSMANFHGMIFSHLNNGYWNPVPAWKPLRELLANKLAGMNNPQREKYLMDLYRRGLSDKESDINYVMDFLKSGPHITERTSQDLLEAFTDWWKKTGQATQKPREWFLNLHTVGNFISKASQYEQQIGRERAFNNWDVKYRGAERLNDEQIRDRAAQVVRETNISYSRASPFIREARKFPVIGTFLTYWEQSFRSYFGSAMHMYKNLLSDNPIRKWDGVARLAGMLTSTLLPAGLQALSQHMFGVSDAEDKHFRSLLPPWEQNQALFYGPMTDKGKRAYWNASYSTQQSDISRSIHALLSFRNNPDGVPGAIRDSIFESGRSFVNLGLVPGALVDLQRNQTEYGTQVYNPQDTWQNITGDVTRHVLQRVAGGTIGRFGNKILPPLLHGGEYTSQSGAVYNWWSGLLPEVSGLNIKEISFPDRFRSEMYTTKANFKNAEKLFTGPIMRSGNQMTDADMEEAYNRSEQARRKVFNDMRSKIEAARFGGMTTQQIRGTLHLRQFSHQMIDDLLSNRYHPYVPSKTIVGNAKANGNRLPARLFSRRAVFLEPEEGEEE